MITVYTSTPNGLLAKIKTAIDEKHIATWKYDTEGDFTHTAHQWDRRAWFVPSVESGVLRFGLLGQKGVIMTKLVYAMYHGHFVDMLLNHFDTQFSSVQVSALGTMPPDVFKTAS